MWFQNRRAKWRKRENTKKGPGRPSHHEQPRSCSGVPLSEEELKEKELKKEERRKRKIKERLLKNKQHCSNGSLQHMSHPKCVSPDPSQGVDCNWLSDSLDCRKANGTCSNATTTNEASKSPLGDLSTQHFYSALVPNNETEKNIEIYENKQSFSVKKESYTKKHAHSPNNPANVVFPLATPTFQGPAYQRRLLNLTYCNYRNLLLKEMLDRNRHHSRQEAAEHNSGSNYKVHESESERLRREHVWVNVSPGPSEVGSSGEKISFVTTETGGDNDVNEGKDENDSRQNDYEEEDGKTSNDDQFLDDKNMNRKRNKVTSCTEMYIHNCNNITNTSATSATTVPTAPTTINKDTHKGSNAEKGEHATASARNNKAPQTQAASLGFSIVRLLEERV